MIRTSDLPDLTISDRFKAAAYYNLWLDGPEEVVANFHRGGGLFSGRDHVIMFLLFLSEIMNTERKR
jgi:hypothetical protein